MKKPKENKNKSLVHSKQKPKRRKKKMNDENRIQNYVLELMLSLSYEERQMLDKIFGCATQAYNALLGEELRRMRLMKQSKAYKEAKKMEKGLEKYRLFNELREKFGFTEYSLHKYSTELKQSWIGDHLGSNLMQALATRAFKAVEKLCVGLARKVRFKKKGSLLSIQEKTNKTGFRWNSEKQCFLFYKMIIDIIYNDKDQYIKYLLGKNEEVKFCRLVRRKIRGKIVYFGQLIIKGKPLSYAEKLFLRGKDPLTINPNQDSKKPIGLDIGPSTIAVVSKDEAKLVRFCDALDTQSSVIRVLNRSIDRKRRVANPDNYDEKGRVKKGKKIWKKSTSQKKDEVKRVEIHRRQSEHRKTLHGELVNQIVSISPFINIEKLSYRSFQKNFGRSVGARAPGMFVEKLKMAAEISGGAVIEFSTYQTRLSQTCICGEIKKKALSERVHNCKKCGAYAQRDLMSAFLACYVQEDTLSVSDAKEAWEHGGKELLAEAYKAAKYVSRGDMPKSFG
jgi:transposase